MKTIPRATVLHLMNRRIRLRFAGIGRNKKKYFEILEPLLMQAFDFQKISANPVTGSLILEGQIPDLETIEQFGRSRRLFWLEKKTPPGSDRVIGSSKAYIQKMGRCVQRISGGRLDMPSLVFFLLIAHAMREIIRGNLAMPSWFSALWFASTLYNREFVQTVDADEHFHADGHSGDMTE